MSLLPSPEPIPPLEHKPRPPPLQQTRRISLSFRKITQATGCITHLDIFVGSLTGTSERFASILAEDAAKYGTVVSLNSLERFNPECFNDPEGPHHSKSRLTVFVVSTHFAGGPSPDAEAFSQWLRLISGDSRAPAIDPELLEEPRPSEVVTTMAPPANGPINPKARRSTEIVAPTSAARPRRLTSFSAAVRPILRMNWRQTFLSRKGSASASKPKSVMHGVQYAVFGVGNSMYLTYNAMGKFVDAKMQALGAVRLCPLGLGDVSGDIDDTFAKWEAQVLQLLVYQKLGPPANIAIQAQAQRRTTFTAEGSGRQLTVQRTLSDPSSGEPAAPRNQPQAPAQEDEVAPLTLLLPLQHIPLLDRILSIPKHIGHFDWPKLWRSMNPHTNGHYIVQYTAQTAPDPTQRSQFLCCVAHIIETVNWTRGTRP